MCKDLLYDLLTNSVELLYRLNSASISHAGISAREKSYYYNIVIADIIDYINTTLSSLLFKENVVIFA